MNAFWGSEGLPGRKGRDYRPVLSVVLFYTLLIVCLIMFYTGHDGNGYGEPPIDTAWPLLSLSTCHMWHVWVEALCDAINSLQRHDLACTPYSRGLRGILLQCVFWICIQRKRAISVMMTRALVDAGVGLCRIQNMMGPSFIVFVDNSCC